MNLNQQILYKWQDPNLKLESKVILSLKENVSNLSKLDTFLDKKELLLDIINCNENINIHVSGFMDVCKGIAILNYSKDELISNNLKYLKFVKNIKEIINNIRNNETILLLSGFDLNNTIEYNLLKQIVIEYYVNFYSIEKLGFKTIETINKKMFCVYDNNEYEESSINKLYSEATIIANGILLSRKLSDYPSNKCVPNDIVEFIKNEINFEINSELTILDGTQIKNNNLGALYAVGKGSINQPYLVRMDYKGDINSTNNYVFAGKGVCFDSGGLWIKTGEGMSSMKYDMIGASVLIGLFKVVQSLKLPINITILLGLVENMPTDRAMRPGDIVTTYSGKTVEIINTDAEGRLVLADLLSYAEKECNPFYLIDIATLTGAIVKTFGYNVTGVMSNEQILIDLFNYASSLSKDLIWQLPLFNIYEEQIKSNIADLCNTPPNNAAQSISAAYFLSKFCEKTKWIHLDIAGTSLNKITNGSEANGKPLNLLLHFLLNQINTIKE